MTNTAERPSRSGAVRTPGPLGKPILTFDLNAETNRLREENAWQGGRDSKTLVKNEDFRIVLTVMKANALLHEHKATAESPYRCFRATFRCTSRTRFLTCPRDSFWRSIARSLMT
jgi:hypothetical protein